MRLQAIRYFNEDDGTGSGGEAPQEGLVQENLAAPVGYSPEQVEEITNKAVQSALAGFQAQMQAQNTRFEEEDAGDEFPDDAFSSVDSMKAFLIDRERKQEAKLRAQIQAEMAPVIVNGNISGIKNGLESAGLAVVESFLGDLNPVGQAQVLSNPKLVKMIRDAARMADADAKTPVPGASGVAPGNTSPGRSAEERDVIKQFAKAYGVTEKEAEKSLFAGK